MGTFGQRERKIKQSVSESSTQNPVRRGPGWERWTHLAAQHNNVAPPREWKMGTPCSPAIPLPGVYSAQRNSFLHKETFTILFPTSIDRWVDKEDVHICTMEYYSAIKWSWVICRDVDGPRDWRKTNIVYQSIYVESRKMFLTNLFQDKNMWTRGGRMQGWGELGDWDRHMYIPTRLFRPWDSPGKSTGVGCHSLLQRIFPTQESNAGIPHCRQTLYRLSHLRFRIYTTMCTIGINS